MLTATRMNERQEEMFLFAISRFWYFVIVLQSHARGISSLEHEFFSQRRGFGGGGGGGVLATRRLLVEHHPSLWHQGKNTKSLFDGV